MPDVTALRDALLDEFPYSRSDPEYGEIKRMVDALIAAARAEAEQRFDEALAMHSEGPHHHYKVTDCIAAIAPERLAKAMCDIEHAESGHPPTSIDGHWYKATLILAALAATEEAER